MDGYVLSVDISTWLVRLRTEGTCLRRRQRRGVMWFRLLVTFLALGAVDGFVS
jgi:hypothetical protein